MKNKPCCGCPALKSGELSLGTWERDACVREPSQSSKTGMKDDPSVRENMISISSILNHLDDNIGDF